MGISEALELLGIEKMTSAQDIKKAWKKQLKKYHPDKAGVDKKLAGKYTEITLKIEEAYRLCLSMVKEIEQKRKIDKGSRVSIIDIESLIKLYKGERVISRVQFDDDIEATEIDKSNIRTRNVLIYIPYILNYNGTELRGSEICKWNMKDMYTIKISVKAQKLCDEHDIVLRISNKMLRIRFSGSTATLNFRLDTGIIIAVYINIVESS